MEEIKKVLVICFNYLKIFIILLFLVAIYSYHSDDPSFSVATGKKPENIFGIYGAYTSDFLIQLFGILSYFLPFIFILNPISILLNKKFQMKYKFLIFSSVLSLGVLNFIGYQHSGIIGFFLNQLLYFFSPKISLILNSIFCAILFLIFIRINLYELQKSKNKKKMKRKNFYSNNLILESIFENLKKSFLYIKKKVFRIFQKKYLFQKTEKSQIFQNNAEKSYPSKNFDSNLQNKKKIIYNSGVGNEKRFYNQKKIIENNNFEEKKSILEKGEVEYKKDGDEIRKTSISYNHNIINSIPRVFENERNQKLYEELQLKKLKELERKKKLEESDDLKISDKNYHTKRDDEIISEDLKSNSGYFNEKSFVRFDNDENNNYKEENISNFPEENFEDEKNDLFEENEDENYEDEESFEENNENLDYYDRDDLLKDLKNNYQKFQSSSYSKSNENHDQLKNSFKSPFINKESENKINSLSQERYYNKDDELIKSDIIEFPKKNSELNELNGYQSEIKEMVKNKELEKKVSVFRESNKVDPKIINIPKRVYPTFKLPDMNFLSQNKSEKIIVDHHQAKLKAEQLIKVLEDFSVYGRILHYHIGPVITLYEFEPLPGTKSSRVIGLCDDIARSLSAVSARISVIAGKNALGIELPNEKRELVLLKEILASKEYTENDFNLPIALGKNIGGEPVVVDLAKMPHLLVAGTTGAGKSVAINVMILSILYSLKPDECKFIMIDPKMLELSVYNGIPHLLTPVVTDPKKAVVALKWVVKEMESRYRMMSYLGVRNIAGYNEKIEEACFDDEELEKVINIGFDKKTGESITEKIIIEKKKFPYIVVIVDEMADLMLVAGKEIEFYIQRLAQMARAAGIHIIMATQRPSVDVITGVIKANLPTRISFAVTSKIDSRTILGEQGAEQLLGLGDMLYMASGNKVVRIHGPFVSDSEVEKVVQYLQSFGPPNYLEEITNQINLVSDDENDEDNIENDFSDESDDCFQQAIELIRRDKKVSISYIQRQLRIGYNKAASIVERMEKEGIVTTPNHQGKRMLVE
jgi:S-DNA-T family DNA segregation ATPase FtsK/SpoIIIE